MSIVLIENLFLTFRENIKAMLKDVKDKEKVKQNGICVDGRQYTINFTGMVRTISLLDSTQN